MHVIDLNTLCGVMLELSYTEIVKIKLSLLGKLKPKIENRGGNALWMLRLGLACGAIPPAAQLSLYTS
jgi:NADH:ubiquinone oxidoreductase subunit B-like Fe-S oxidoreductase